MRYLTFLLCLPLSAAISNIRVIGSTQSQIALSYTAPDTSACSVDAVSSESLVSRSFTATGNGTTVTMTIAATKLDIPTGQGIYIYNSGVSQWDGWQTTTSVTDNGTQTTVTFSSATSGTAGGSATAYLPVVDINTAIFTTSNLDSRSGALMLGRSRTFVLGTRGAQRGTATGQSTRYFSRTLQPATKHLVMITCGSDTATTTAWTTTIPVGATGGTALPADRNNPGVLAEPTFDWQDTSKWYTDPTTGLLTKMLSVPGVRYATTTGQAFATAIDQTGTAPCTNNAWTNVCGPTQAGSGSATITNSTTAAFFRTQSIAAGGAVYTEYGINGQTRGWQFFTATLTGSSTSTGNNATVQVALTGNGVTPYTTWKDVDLTTCASGCKIGAFTVASDAGKPVADNWLVETPTGWPVVSDKEMYPRCGTVSVADGGTSISWVNTAATVSPCTSKAYKFNELWTAGTHLTINGQDCTIASVQSETALTVNSCGLSAGTYTYSASNAGLLVRNKVSSGATNTISALSYEYVTDATAGEPSDGGFSAFNTVSYSGYYPLMLLSYGSTQSLYSLNATTAASRYLGSFRIPARTGGFNTWTGQQTPAGSSAKWDVTGANPTYYWTATQGSNVYLVKIEYTGSLSASLGGNYTDTIGRGTCTNSGYVMTCSDTKYTVLTPKYNESGGAAVNHDLHSLILAFDTTANTHLLTTANCGINQVYNNGLILYTCPAGNASDRAFLAYVIDLGDGDPTHAGTTGAHIIARVGSDSPSLRACTLHSPLDMGPESGYAELSLQLLGGGTTDGKGPWYVTTQDAITGTPSETCPDSTPNACTTVTVDAFADTGGNCPSGVGSLSPYDPTPNAAETGCPGEYISPAVGDLVFFTKASTGIVTLSTTGDEGATLVAINGNQFTFKRGTYNSPKAYSAGGTFLSWHCKAQLLTSTTPGNKVFWDLANDPAGDNVVFDSQNRSSHQALWFYSSPPYGAYSEGMANSTSFCLNAFTACWHNTTGPPSGADKIFDKIRNKTNMNPGFAGTVSVAGSSVNVWQTHPGVSYTRGIDFRSRGGGPGTAAIGFAQNWAKVGSTSYLWKTAGTLDSSTDTISGDVVLHRKVYDTWASCGMHPLVDASPAVLADTSADWYKYVVVRNAGEGYAGSTAGEVYVNCPNVSTTAGTADCYGTIADIAHPLNSSQVPQTICMSDSTWWSNAVVDYSLTNQDPFGWHTRVLSAMTSTPAATSPFANAHVSPDERWLIWNHPYLNYFRTTTLVGKMPPMAATSTATRNSFRLRNIVLHPPSGVDNVITKVGYAEYGSPSSFYCTPRAEACVIGASRTDANPFQYASESITGISVSGGAVTIPLRLIPGRIAYWQYLYRGASGNVLSTSPIQVAVAP